MQTSLLFLLFLFLPACASTPIESSPRSPVWFNGHTGALSSEQEVLSAAANADAILIGENHGHPLGLATAASLFQDLLNRTDHAALSLEFFERDEQTRIDEYLAGLTDEKKFKARTSRTASSYPQGHRDMLEAAKAAHRPVFAANAPRPQVTAAGKEGGYDTLRKLPPDLQAQVRIPDEIPTGRYRDDFDKVMSDPNAAHGPAPKTPEEKQQHLDNAFRGQSLWDWTMADSIAKALAAGNSPVVHVVGRFHIDHHGGLILALERLRPGVKVRTISFIDAWSDSLRPEDKDRADFVVYVGPDPQAR